MPRHDRAAPRILEDLGAYALHALPDKEARDLEVHLRGCPACQHELERLKVAADALARSVDPVPPPPGLRQRVVEVVRAEEGAAPRSRKAERRAERRRLAALLPRPAIRPAVAVTLAALAAGLAGWALGSAGGPEARTVAVAVDRARLPTASGELSVDRAGESAVLRLAGIPKLGPGQTYELWVERDDRVRPGPLFQPNPRGSAVTGVAGDLSEVEAILVTREAAGGARTPSEPPVVQARLE